MNETINTTTLSRGWMEFLNRSTATIAIETSTLLLIGLIAIGGNLLVVMSIYHNPSLRTITNYFVLSLAISDVLFPIMCLPLTLAWSIKSRFIFGQEMCDYQVIVSSSLMQVSIATIALMAFNRFVRVCKPHKYNIFFNKKTSLIMIGAIWIIFIMIFSLNITGGKFINAKFKPKKIMCHLSQGRKTLLSRILLNVSVVILLVLPFAIIVYCYFKVFKKIREHKKNIAPSSNTSGLGTSVQEIKVTWTLFAVLLGYCVIWFPVLIVVVASSLTVLPSQAHMIVTYSMASSSAINPIIYGVMNPVLRREFVKILWSLVCK